MIIAGAGGHAKEVLDILVSTSPGITMSFLDENKSERFFCQNYSIIQNEEEILAALQEDPRFVLGTGKPETRKAFYDKLTRLGGEHFSLRGMGLVLSSSSDCLEADIFSLCFVGPNTHIGKGCLVNTGAQIHHEVEIGDFTEISPAAVILGKAKIGSFCIIGSNATILPKVNIGSRAIIGAGAVVTIYIPDVYTVV